MIFKKLQKLQNLYTLLVISNILSSAINIFLLYVVKI